MEAKSHIDVEGVKNIFEKLTEFALLKWLVANFFVLLAWSFNGKVEVLATIYILIALDTVTGVWIAAKKNEVSSRGFYRVVTKCFVYFIMLLVGRLVDKNIPLPIAAPILDAFLVTTEAVSILENFSKLGFPVPTILVNKLKAFYEKK